MGDLENLGKALIYTGLFIAIIGGIIALFGQNLSWIGNLPGDIKIEKENFTLFFPLSSMILISLLLNLVIYLIRILIRFF